MSNIRSAVKLVVLAVCAFSAASVAQEPAADWQSFPSHRLANSMMCYSGLVRIEREQGPKQHREGGLPRMALF